jgi:hypothetical protein
MTIGLAIFVVLAWKERYWGLFGRFHYTLVVAALIVLIAVLGYWNLLGFRY